MRHVSVTAVASAADDAWEAFDGLECLISVYGMTESCSIITAQPKTSGARSGADSGFPNTTAMLKVVDFATGEKLGPRQIGEIRFQIEGAARGYYKRPKETTELFDEEGWCVLYFRVAVQVGLFNSKLMLENLYCFCDIPGDAGYYDEDGRLFIVERVKQLIKCMDNQVAPAELEELLLREHSTDIAEISVVGLSHSEYGEAPAAAVVLTHEGRNKNQKLLAKAIEATVKGHLAAHKHLHGGVFFVDSLPKTDTAKVNKPMLLRLITQEQMFSS
ncbi:hypothetical protein MRX96_009361 [Rhipicephalus microplus]